MFKSRLQEQEIIPPEPEIEEPREMAHTFEEDVVETIVGPSVEVEGDFSSKGNMVVQGTVAGNVRTEKNLRVEQGAKILANVHAHNAKISGEIRGNVKITNTLELTPTAVVVGDVNAATLIISAGAILHGKCSMPGDHLTEAKQDKNAARTVRSRTRQTSSSEELASTLEETTGGYATV